MASLFDKIKDIFKPNTQTTTPAATQQSTPARTTTNVANRPVGTQRVFAPASQPSTVAQPTQTASSVKAQPKFGGTSRTVFGKNETSTSLAPVTSIGSKGSLSERAIKNGQSKGEDWSKASDAQKKYNETYYRTLDNPTHTKMYTDLEKASDSKTFQDLYKSGREKLDAELKDVGKQYGKNSDEYKALQQFSGDYEKLRNQYLANQSYDDASRASRQLDQTINTVFAGYKNDPNYAAKVEAGKKEILGNPQKYKAFTLGMKGASEEQKNLLYAVFADEGEKGARDFYDRFLSSTVSQVGAAKDFAKGITDESKAKRTMATVGGAIGGIVSQDSLLGGGLRKAADALTGRSEALDDDVLAGDFTVQDSVDNYLRKEFSGINDADLQQYGGAGFREIQPTSDWFKDAEENATDYQKNLLGYVYLASNMDEDAAKELWNVIKERDAGIRETVNGSLYGNATRDAVASSLYQNYLSNNEIVEGLYKLALTTGSQVSRTALSFIPVIGQALSLATMGASVFGDVYDATRAEGHEKGESLGYAATKGAFEIASEYLFGGILKVPGIAANAVSKNFVRNITNPAMRVGARMANRFIEEGFEEYGTDFFDPLITNLWLGEGDLAQRLKAGVSELDPTDEEALESFLYGGLSALLLGGAGEISNIRLDKSYSVAGKALNTEEATDKLVDTILGNPVDAAAAKTKEAKRQVKLYEEAKKIARNIRDGKYKPTDYNVGEMFIKYGESGGDLQWLANPDTVSYNKESLTEDNLIAGAKSMLVELGGDAKLAEDIVKAYRGEQISQETLRAIQADTNAMQVLTQLQGNLDMSKDTALSRAARASTRAGTGNQVYDTLKAENTDKTIATPAAQRLYEQNVEWDEAQQIGGLIDKVMTGEAITEDEAELISVGIPAVRSVIQEITGVELSESSTIGAVMTAMNDVAAQMAKTKEMQAAVKESTKQTARMPIPPAASGNSIGGIEYSHDDFVRDYMAKNNATLEQAEEAWNQRRLVDTALSGEEENNGKWTIPGNPEGRDVGVGSRGAVSEGTERRAGSGQTLDSRRGEGDRRDNGSRDGEIQTDAGRAPEEITKYNTKQREFVQSAKDDGFTSVSLILGDLRNSAGQLVNAMVENGNLTIRWDNPIADPRRIEQHEKIHLWLDALGADRESFVNNALLDIFGDNLDALNAMIKTYKRVYKNSYAGLSNQAFADAVNEEILADIYAGLDLYHAGTEAYQQAAELYIVNAGLEDTFFGTETGSNYGESFDRFNVADPFRESTDWDIPSDVRPYPGEKPMHDQMPKFSLSSMAEGGNFDLQYNDAGQPYALIDRGTGKQVTEVTAGMMVNTPLGNIVEMAVDNGNITEDEAKVQLQMLADAMNLIVKYNDAAVVWEAAGSQLFSAIKSNSDKQYNKTIDFSTICKKTMAIVDAMSETMKRLGRGLTRREVEAVYLETGKAGEATPCPVCYVFSRWMGIGNLLDQMSKFQDKYAGKSEEELVSFMKDIEDRAKAFAEAASASKKKDYYDAAGNLKIGKVLSDMKSKPNSRAAAAIRKLNMHQQANVSISELITAMENATPEQQARWKRLIQSLKRNVLKDYQITELQMQMEEADAEAEVFEVYQWLAKTVLTPDASQVNEDGEAIGSWKKNPDFKPVPKDILFDLNRGGDFAKDYPLSWSFRTGKGCAMGKAITPYADARVGETIQGVAMDVKNIRVGAEINEFLNGDTKKQQSTLESARKKQKQQNLIGGMRYQSTSDFRYEFGSDYLMTFFEMQALGANVQLYTKVIEAVDFLASTGADCNLSVMPLGDGYVTDPKTGKKKLVFSNVTGINAEAAIKKAKQYDNVQLILVGINDENIRLALEGTDVTFVIPFHGSGQSVHQVQTLMDLLGEHLDVTQAQDYTSVQSDHVSPNQTTEQKAMWDLRMAIIMGECADGLTAEQQALLNKNTHLQKLYDMFYVDETAPAYQNFLAKDQAEHIFPYEYWNREGDYEHADENGRVFQDYCKSMGIIPRFSGRNSKGERTGFGDFTKDKGYWKLLIDRSMYENVYDANGEWIGYGKYRDQQQINMSNVKLSDLDPETGKAQFTNGEMSKQYDATHSETDRQNLDTIVTNSIQRIEAMRDKGDVFDKTQVTKGFRKNIMATNSELRGLSAPARPGTSEQSTRYSLAPVDAVEPSSDSWSRTRTTEEAMEAYPNLWNVAAEESETRNPTQIASTQGTYRNIYKILQSQGFDGTILDASSGLGIGTQIGRDEFGFDVEDIEPYPGDNYSPMYTDYSKLNKKYDAIISSAVLNVLPQDQRDALVIKMGKLLKDGGKMYITTRGKDVESLANTGKNIRLGPMEWIETVRGSYQKGFTQAELKAYLEDALGPGFTVELSNKSNGGKFNNNTSIVVTKNQRPSVRYSFAGSNAETADDRNRQRAERMEEEGYGSEEIRKETGWFRGMDDEWRFEIDNKEMSLSDAYSPDRDSYKLGELVNHDKLFEAYPSLADYTVEVADLDNGTLGRFNKYAHEITVDRSLFADKKELRKTLIHEIQHAIQAIEGFAYGSSPAYWRQNMNRRHSDLRNRMLDLTDELRAAEGDLEDELFYIGYERKKQEVESRIWMSEISRAEGEKELQDFLKERSPEGYDLLQQVEQMREELKQVKADLRKSPSASDLYKRTAGEIEARDVEKRLNLDEKKRQDKRPDIDRKNVVFARYSAAPTDSENAEETNTKANPYKEGTFEYTVYDMLGKINSPQELQDYINGLREKQQQDAEARNASPEVIPKGNLPPVNKEQQKIRRNQLDKLIEKYGAFKPGEKAARGIRIPEKVSDDRRVRRAVRTIVEAKAIPDRLAERIGGEVLVNELLTYEPITDSDALSRGRSELGRLGYKKALEDWAGKSSTDHFPTKYDIAFGGLLLREAARQGDDAVAMQIAADLAAMEGQAGQVAQAGRLLKQLGPTGQLYYIQKAVDRINHQNEGRIAKGGMQPIVIDKDLAREVITSESQEDIDAAMDKLIQSIADQLPVTLKDRWDAWRYLSMLGNPRTHIRNIAGNAIFAPVRFAKDLLAAGGERMFIKDESQRTKDARALFHDSKYRDVREFAEADYAEMERYLTGTGKMNPINEIMSKRKVLPGVLDKISRKNDDWLTGEDAFFLKRAYVNALTQFIAARGVSLEDLSADVEGAKILNEARKYAAIEAQKATYRDFSRVASAMNGLRRVPGLGLFLDSLMPFTKTPINILKRGLEYSPAGLAKALTYDLNRVKKGDITAAEAIDHAAAGMTGTSIALLGWLMASLGMARGGSDDDDKKDALEKSQGHQDYSIEIDGKSYTIDWMAPVALPFFVGVEAYKQITGDGPASFFDFVNAVTLICEPMMSLSMLDGINSTLSAVRSNSNSPIQAVGANLLASYVSQGAPTLFGQFARLADPDRRSTYVDKNSENPAFIQRFVQNVQGKVPGLASQKMAYVDTWGRKDTNESIFLRGLENFISPGYANRIVETPVDMELLRLYDATGDNSMLPGTVAKYFQVEGETLNLTADQYEEFKTVTGKTAFELIGELIGDVAYNGLSDADKSKAVQQALKIATAIGKQKVAPTYQTDGWIQRAIDHDNLETSAIYHTLEGLDTGLSNYQLISAMDWLTDDERGKLIMAEHPNTNRNMTDYTRKKHKFVLTDDQIKREREIYEGLFWPEYAALFSNPKYINGDITTRAELIKDMQSDVSTEARKALGNELRAAGYTSVILDDSDVPDQVANLYDLLNRG